MSKTNVNPNQNNVAATYVIKKGDKTDEIVCYGKETMSASDLEKILKEHFAKMGDTPSSIATQPSSVSKKSDISVGAALKNLGNATQDTVTNAVSKATGAVTTTVKEVRNRAANVITNVANQATDRLKEATKATEEEKEKLTAQAANIAKKVNTMLPTLRQDNVNPNTPAPLPLSGRLSGTITEQPSVKKQGGKRKTKKYKRKGKQKGKRKGKKNRKTKKSIHKKKKTRKRKHKKKRKSVKKK